MVLPSGDRRSGAAERVCGGAGRKGKMKPLRYPLTAKTQPPLKTKPKRVVEMAVDGEEVEGRAVV